jgi:beta-N-acetylhexosaminidase
MTLGPLMIDVAGVELDACDREILRHPLVGGVILFTRNFSDPEQLTRLVTEIHAARSPALLVAVDQEGGRVQRFRGSFSRLPPLRRIGLEFDLDRARGLELARELGWLMAAELRACGVDLSFAPCVDLDYGVSEVIGDRALHARAHAVADLAMAYVHGMRDAGMAATPKHFPGHGAVVADSHLALPVDRRAFADLDADLLPYRRLIANGVAGVMVAHIAFPQVDERPASLSSRWVRGVLRGELGFAGAVFTDDLSMQGAKAFGEIEVRARAAHEAGCDMLTVCNDRAAVERLLETLDLAPDPAAHLRLARLRGRDGCARDELLASDAWRASQRALAHVSEPPALVLEARNA